MFWKAGGSWLQFGKWLRRRLTFLLSLGGEQETRSGDYIEVEGSVYEGRGFGPCLYPKGWTLNKFKSSSSSYTCFERLDLQLNI